jgi:ribosomal-protein-alanine N-acetyltransferase
MQVSDITVLHADILAELHRTSFSHPWDSRAFYDLLVTPGVFGCLVYDEECECNPVGLCLGRIAADETELLTICVLPNYRGKGLSRILLRRLFDAARDRGAETMYLEVSVENSPARCLYADLGFKIVGYRPGYYAESTEQGTRRIDAELMVKSFS